MELLHVTELESPIGMLRIAETERGLAWIGLPHGGGRALGGWMRRHAPQARRVPAASPSGEATTQLLEYLAGRRRRFDLALDLRGTPFQQAVWRALLAIPYGETASYVDVARALGRPEATRAVGAANGANPLPLVVPCHRVIAASGELGGYGGGLELKARLLAMERGHAEQVAQGRLL
jgi:O-6-methylguanine DNA methyltransferase